MLTSRFFRKGKIVYIRVSNVRNDMIKKIIKIWYDTKNNMNMTRIHEYDKIVWIKKIHIKIYIIF